MADDGPEPAVPERFDIETPRAAKQAVPNARSADADPAPSARSDAPTPSPGDNASPLREKTVPKLSVFGWIRTRFGRSAANGADHTSHAANAHGAAEGTSGALHTRREMIERIIAFDEMRVVDVMMPRADIAAVDIDTPLRELIREFSEAGHSRMPVYRDDLDDPVGMVHIKDLIGMLARNGHGERDLEAVGSVDDASADNVPATAEPILKDILRKVLYVPPSMKVVDLFLRMQVSRIHMALVIDEFGGTDGLVTIEDLIEQIVGEINDEHDEDDGPLLKQNGLDGWDSDARVELEELEALTGLTLADGDDDVDTVGGLVFSLAGRVPLRGEIIMHPQGLEFEVLDADVRKIRKIRIKQVDATKMVAEDTA